MTYSYKFKGAEARTLGWQGRLVFPGQNFDVPDEHLLNYDVPGLYEPADPATKKALKDAKAAIEKALSDAEKAAAKQAEEAATAHLVKSEEI